MKSYSGPDQSLHSSAHTVFDYRFAGVRRLYGTDHFSVVSQSHILVIGLGGVGSWVVEALARSGVGKMTLVDFDDICISNTNRQIQAVTGNIGKMKTTALKERVMEINPHCEVIVFDLPFGKDSSQKIFQKEYSVVIDSMDDSLSKEYLAAHCREAKIPLVLCGAAAGRQDPSLLRVADLAKATTDTMLSMMRKNLRKFHGFPRENNLFGVSCVYSIEKPSMWDDSGKQIDPTSKQGGRPLDCDQGLGTSMLVTNSFAMLAVAQCFKLLESKAHQA